MKKLLAIVFLALVLYGIWWWFFKESTHQSGPKVEALKVGHHSNQFNQSITNAVSSYLDIKAAFVEADSVKAKAMGVKFISMLDSLKLDDLKKDTTGILSSAQAQMGDIKINAESMIRQPNLLEMRQDFRMVTENFYPFLKTIHYEGPKLYLQNCPMAFGEGKDANWISNTEEIVNPYLGKKHPEFKATMLHCGTIVDTIK